MNPDFPALLLECQKAISAVLDDEVCSPERALELNAIEVKLRVALSAPRPRVRLLRTGN